MNDIGDMVSELIRSGCTPEVAAAVVARAFVSGASSVEFRGIPVDKAAEKRRAYDRERKRKGAGNPPASTGIPPETEERPLIVEEKEEGLSIKQESKKERVSKKRSGILPENWQPPARAFEVAAELGLAVPPIEARFRDYLKSSGKLYADHDAAFCNFIRMTPKFGGGSHGNAVSNNRTDPAAGRATARETQHVANMGGAALRYLQRGEPAGTGRGTSAGADTAEVFDFKSRAEGGD
jgi:hypothetical protein